MNLLINGDARHICLPDKSVHCVVTSPPYYGLRDYGTAEWVGGDAECDHNPQRPDGGDRSDRTLPLGRGGIYREVCPKCGAVRIDKQVGLEQTPDDYVNAMVQVFREVRRVLRDDGTAWLNLGDSYNSRDAGANPGGFQGALMRQDENRNKAHPRNTMKGDLPGLKPKDLIGIPWRVAFALQGFALINIDQIAALCKAIDDRNMPALDYFRSGFKLWEELSGMGWYWNRQDIIWCLSGGVKVYAKTQKAEGPMLIKDLARLEPETVQLWNGYKWTQVLGWNETPRPSQPLEIVLRSGERIGCTPEHKWPTQRGLLKASELRVGDVIDSCRLPQPEIPETPNYIPDDVGYFVGMYIAEGSMSGDTIQIACHTKETARYKILKVMAEGYGGTANWYSYKGKSAMIHIHCPVMKSILNMYVSGRIAKNKRLNPTAWKRSDKFLDSVLLGYLAGDGHQDGERWRLGFTRNYEWEQDLRTICARLGYQLRLKPVNATYQSGISPAFRGEIRFKKSDYHNAKEDAEIVEIRNSRARKFYDIGVADEPHVFALASGVFTHNSKPNPMPESVKDRCTKSHEYIFLLTKSERYWYDNEAIKEPASYPNDDRKARSLEFHKSIPDGLRNGLFPGHYTHDLTKRNKRDVWIVPTKPYPGSHYAVFPPDLIEPCILAGCPETVCAKCGAPYERVKEVISEPDRDNQEVRENRIGVIPGRDKACRMNSKDMESIVYETKGWQPTCSCDAGTKPGIVLDPFIGSGTVLWVAENHNRNAIGIDLSFEYLNKDARKRVDYGGYRVMPNGMIQEGLF